MRIARILQLSVCTAVLCATHVPGAKADDWNRKTIATFSDSVQIPGQVLPAGTYVFKLANTNDRHIVQIWSADESQLCATVMAIPVYVSEPPDDVYFRIDERPSGEPQAVGAWFYPGDTCGNEFLHPHYGYSNFAKTNY